MRFFGKIFGNTILKPMTSKEYSQYRDKVDKYFENKYDYNTLDGINSIPDKEDFYGNIRADDTSVERIEAYLRRKAWMHEENGNIELCIACLKKANQIMENSEIKHSDMMMSLVDRLRIYRRFDEARDEKARLEKLFVGPLEDKDKEFYYALYEQLPAVCPKSYGGFKRMKNMKSTNYAKIMKIAKESGISIK